MILVSKGVRPGYLALAQVDQCLGVAIQGNAQHPAVVDSCDPLAGQSPIDEVLPALFGSCLWCAQEEGVCREGSHPNLKRHVLWARNRIEVDGGPDTARLQQHRQRAQQTRPCSRPWRLRMRPRRRPVPAT